MRAPTVPLALLLAAAALGGCSTRRVLTIDSEPRGARVWVDGAPRGVTPVDVPFLYYGRMHVRLEKDGHEALATEVEVPAAIDGYPVIDLPYELTVRERRWRWTGRLRPLDSARSDEDLDALLDRARAFRTRTLEEATPEATGVRVPAPVR